MFIIVYVWRFFHVGILMLSFVWSVGWFCMVFLRSDGSHLSAVKLLTSPQAHHIKPTSRPHKAEQYTHMKKPLYINCSTSWISNMHQPPIIEAVTTYSTQNFLDWPITSHPHILKVYTTPTDISNKEIINKIHTPSTPQLHPFY
jgi:hypothetical protein